MSNATHFVDANSPSEPMPDAPFYVVCHDTFLSGWGPARGKRNLCVVPCSSFEEADRVRRYVESRNDMEDVQIVSEILPEGRDILYSLLPGWTKVAENFNEEVSFPNAPTRI